MSARPLYDFLHARLTEEIRLHMEARTASGPAGIASLAIDTIFAANKEYQRLNDANAGARPPVPNDGGGNIHERGPTALGGDGKVLREQAKAQGFNGDACTQCGNFTMQRVGTCLTCRTCGSTTGCS